MDKCNNCMHEKVCDKWGSETPVINDESPTMYNTWNNRSEKCELRKIKRDAN